MLYLTCIMGEHTVYNLTCGFEARQTKDVTKILCLLPVQVLCLAFVLDFIEHIRQVPHSKLQTNSEHLLLFYRVLRNACNFKR